MSCPSLRRAWPPPPSRADPSPLRPPSLWTGATTASAGPSPEDVQPWCVAARLPPSAAGSRADPQLLRRRPASDLQTTIITCVSLTLHALNYQKPAQQRQVMRVLCMPLVYAVGAPA